ncbi:hypothetical protein F4821DRAFT_144276 [Hypoxylon rubiginosum]|uniref:Uncharacterized protein n=1 Tax=Hypoxylon rubiginosum TaxID=110542 RepID=A0ACC0D000_9PEZI|nr:hypothetical protein F4821DRAFT_144276 [Hypoxylon rubiginosum]
MTTKILNKTWLNTLRDQYQQDLETEITFPLTYIFYYQPQARDLRYEINHKITVAEFETSLKAFRRSDLSSKDNPSYEDQNVKIFPQPEPQPDFFYIHDRLPSDSESDADETSAQPKTTK